MSHGRILHHHLAIVIGDLACSSFFDQCEEHQRLILWPINRRKERSVDNVLELESETKASDANDCPYP
jgi:hypothetical protein